MATPTRANNSLTINFAGRQSYEKYITNSKEFIKYVVISIKQMNFKLVHRDGCLCSFELTGFCTYQRKRNSSLIIWRLQCKCCKKTWSVLPEFALRYCGLSPEKAMKCLYNTYYGSSLAVNSNLFEVSAMTQYSYICAIGRFDLVKMLINCHLALPQFIICDEKHSRCQGEAVYLPTIVSGRVIWNLDYSKGLTEPELIKSYGEFKQSALAISPDYCPKGILTDGFASTIKCMKALYFTAIIGICLFHASLLICRTLKKTLGDKAEVLSKSFFNIFGKLGTKDWLPVFKAGQRIRRYKEKLKKIAGEAASPIAEWIDRKKSGWYKVIETEKMPKTTTLLDQAHNAIERKLFNMKQFHHTNGRQVDFLKGFAMLYNIIPYQTRAKNADKCGIQVEGGILPTNNWMLNLQILTSGGYQLVT